MLDTILCARALVHLLHPLSTELSQYTQKNTKDRPTGNPKIITGVTPLCSPKPVYNVSSVAKNFLLLLLPPHNNKYCSLWETCKLTQSRLKGSAGIQTQMSTAKMSGNAVCHLRATPVSNRLDEGTGDELVENSCHNFYFSILKISCWH